MRRSLLILIAFTAGVFPILSAEPPKVSKVSTPADAQALALQDLKTLPAEQVPFTRYVWLRRISQAKLGSLTINYVSRGAIITKPDPIAWGVLLRIDLRKYSDSLEDIKEWIELWENFQFDPSFSLLITRDTIEQVRKTGVVLPGVEKVGKEKILLNRGEDKYVWVDVIRVPGASVDPKVNDELVKLTGSLAPVVEHDYWTYRMLSTVKDEGLYSAVFGGLYYDFVGIKKSTDKGATDEDLLFEKLGIGDTKKGVTASVIFERVKSDRKAAMFRSGVTGKPRTVDILKSLLGVDEAVLMVTHDISDKDNDIKRHPMMNLVKFEDRAREEIFTMRNGLHGFALFDGKGKLQDEAPFDVVVDHKIPEPYTKRLQGAISCIRCHGIDGSDGVKPFKNDVQTLLSVYNLDAFGDITDENKTIHETLMRLAGQYKLSPNKTIGRVREDYIEGILRATGPWKEAKDQTEVGQLSAKGYEQLWKDYWYTPVDAKQALYELGYDVPKENVDEFFRVMCPPDRSSQINQIIPEDPRIGALRAGLSISRSDWGLVYSFVAARVKQSEAKLKGDKK